MTIGGGDGVRVVTVGDVLSEHRLSIPRYQRPYSWLPATALQLLDDVEQACHQGAASYVLGSVILHRDADRLDVVDGQQRLLTLALLTSLLSNPVDAPLPQNEPGASPLVAVHTALARRLQRLPADRFAALTSFVRDRCWLVCVQTADEDEAFRVFDSQNYRGRPLLPHDLLKAYHLREMVGAESEAMQAAVVEGWERVPDADLDRLFSIYLYRIRRWSQGLPAPRFTAQDIGLFKGVRSAHDRSPAARYHLAAQAAVPVLAAWRDVQAPSADDRRDAQRARFQIDAPLTAGRPFFEMVTFLLDELEQLRKDYYETEWEDFASTTRDFQERSGRGRFRYVSELYLATALYYSNRFGRAEADEARERLFSWAYALRVQLTRVQFASVDNLARHPDSAFWLIRGASSPSELRRLVPPPGARLGRDPRLVDALAQLGSG